MAQHSLYSQSHTYLVQADSDIAYPSLDHTPQHGDIIFQVQFQTEAGASFGRQRIHCDA